MLPNSCFQNRRYREMTVAPGVYVPERTTAYPEEDSFQHLVPVQKTMELTFDENYPYLDDSEAFRREHRKCYATAFSWCFLMNPLRYGLRIRGREILKKYKKELAGGAITICNHAYRWDLLSVLQAVRWRELWIPVYGENLMTSDHWYIKHIGGIPVPSGMAAMKKFNAAFDELHRRKKWFHVFPEECRWDYYKPIRPFRKGAFSMAYKYNMPILPCCLTYRKRTGLYRLFGDQSQPLLTITIGEPIFPNPEAHRRDEVERLREVAHHQMEQMAGITHNPWPVAPEGD
jgi:1-acyl-sn-glycerol-3-phosphate acyltransferase